MPGQQRIIQTRGVSFEIFSRPESKVVAWKQLFTIHPEEFVAEFVLVEENDQFLVGHVIALYRALTI